MKELETLRSKNKELKQDAIDMNKDLGEQQRKTLLNRDHYKQVDFNLAASKARVEELEAALSESQATARTVQQRANELASQVEHLSTQSLTSGDRSAFELEVQTLRKEVETKTALVEKWEKKAFSHPKANRELELEVHGIQTKLDLFDDEKAAIQQELDDSKARELEAQAEIAKLQTIGKELETTKKELDAEQAALAEAQSSKRSLEINFKAQQRNLNENAKIIAELDSNIQSLNIDLEVSRNQTDEAQNSLQRVTPGQSSHVKGIEDQLAASIQENKQATEENDALKAKNAELKNDLTELNNEINVMQRATLKQRDRRGDTNQSAEGPGQSAELQEQSVKVQMQSAKLQKQQAEIDSLKQQLDIRALSTASDTCVQTNTVDSAEADRLQTEVERLRDEVKRLGREKKRSDLKVTELETKNEYIETKVKKSSPRTKRAPLGLPGLDDEIASLAKPVVRRARSSTVAAPRPSGPAKVQSLFSKNKMKQLRVSMAMDQEYDL